MENRGKSIVLLSLIGFWFAAVVAGMGAVVVYKTTPGAPAKPEVTWPRNAWVRPTDRPTLVMVMHPMCSCSQASVTELTRLTADLPNPLAVVILFRDFDPSEQADDIPKHIESLELWKRSAAIPGATVISDKRGKLAKMFKAHTSGSTIVYDKEGRLVFNGGITASRGHEGDSFGRTRLLALLNGKPTDKAVSPVFGCGLDGPGNADLLFPALGLTSLWADL